MLSSSCVRTLLVANAGIRSSVVAFASAAPAPKSSTKAQYWGTFDYRRLAKRQQWANESLWNEDSDVIVYPRDGIGRDSDVNWSLNRHKITPQKHAYRNLHLRGLNMLVPSAKNVSGGIAVDRVASKTHKVFVVLPTPPPPTEGQAPVQLSTSSATPLTDDAGNRILRNIRAHFSNECEELFVHDGAINSGAAKLSSRSVTDNAATALLLHNTVIRSPLGEVLAYPVESFSLLSNSIATENGESYTLLHLPQNTVAVGGNYSSSRVIDALAALANYQLWSRGSGLPLPKCHSAVTNAGTTLVFGASQPVMCAELFGAHNNVWLENGVARSFGGAVVENSSATKFGASDLIERYGGNSTHVAARHSPAGGYFTKQPSAAVFVVDESFKSANVLSRVSIKQARELFGRLVAAHVPGVDVTAMADRFAVLADTHGMSHFYAVNAHTAKPKDVQQAVAAATLRTEAPTLDAALFNA